MRPQLAFRPYEPGDADRIAQPTYDSVRGAAAMDWPLKGQGMAPGLSWTITRAGEPIACGGAVETEVGTWMLWGYAGQVRWAEWGFVTGCIRSAMRALRQKPDTNRFLAAADTLIPCARPFLERLGFKVVDVCTFENVETDRFWLMARML